MKNILLIFLGLLISTALYSQSKQKIISEKISSVTTYEQRLDKGIDDKYVIEELKYDDQGRLIELKEITRKGEIKRWEKYIFDTQGNLTEEISFDLQGRVKKREVTHYEGNLRVYKEYFDDKGRMYKKKTYAYTFGK